VKVEEVYEQFVRQRALERSYSDESLTKLRNVFHRWILPKIDTFQVEELTLDRLLRIQESLRERGLSTATETTIMAFVRAFLRFVKEKLHIESVPPNAIALPKRLTRAPEFLTNEEVGRLRVAIEPRGMAGFRLRALVELLLATGLRLGEALSLDRAPFESFERQVQIQGKGGKERCMLLTEECHFWVRQYLTVRCDRHPALFVTISQPPERWAKMDVSRFFIRLRIKAKISKHLTPHLLRHTFCSNLRNHGADISVIKELAGHSDIDTTIRYYLGKDNVALMGALKKHLNYRDTGSEAKAA
jgi:integrase/recombinase XerD